MSKAKVWFRKIWSEKLDDVDVKVKYQVEISNRFAALESLDESFHINNAWESIRESIKTSANENLGYHKLKINRPTDAG
jgi:hypothetical protein